MNKPKPFLRKKLKSSWELFTVTFIVTLIVFGVFYSRNFALPSDYNATEKLITYIFNSIFTYILFFILGLLISIVYHLVKRSLNKNNLVNIFMAALYVTIAICALFIYGLINSKNNDSNPKIVTKNNMIKSVYVSSSFEKYPNIKESEFNSLNLKTLEEKMVINYKKILTNTILKQGNNLQDYSFRIKSASKFINIKNKKLAVIRLLILLDKNGKATQSRAVFIVGFISNGIANVTCVRPSNHEISISSDKCGNKIQEIYKVSFVKGSGRIKE